MGGRDGTGGGAEGGAGQSGGSCAHAGKVWKPCTKVLSGEQLVADAPYVSKLMSPASIAACDHATPCVHTWSATPSPSQSTAGV